MVSSEMEGKGKIKGEKKPLGRESEGRVGREQKSREEERVNGQRKRRI